MKLPIPKLFPKKGASTDYLLALLLRDEKVSAVIVEKLDGKMKVIGQHTEYFSSSLEDADSNELLEILDKTISKAEDTLPPNIETKDTIFGVKDEWVEEKKIKREYLLKLKKVSEALDLVPVGFLVISEAVARLIQEEEGAPLSAILAEIGKNSINLVLFRGGKIVDSQIGPVEESPMATVDALLKHFTVEVLPSRIILSHGGKDQGLVQKFITHQWSKSLPFLHVPQISILPDTFDARSIVFGAATQMGLEILGQDIEKDATEIQTFEQGGQIDHATIPGTIATPIISPEEHEKVSNTATEQANEDASDPSDIKPPLDKVDEGENASDEEKMVTADNFGFISDEDIEKIRPNKPHEVQEMSNKTHPHSSYDEHITSGNDNEEEERPSIIQLLQEKAMLVFGMLKFAPGLGKKVLASTSMIKGNKLLLIPLIVIVALIAVGIVYAQIAKATITLNLNPHVVEEKQEISFSPDYVNDFSKQTLQAAAISSTLEGTATTNATGKKDVGEKAKGTVTLYNNNDARRQLTAGTTITSSNNLEYVLDKDVVIASQSGDFFTGTKPGTANATVTAKVLGPDHNLPSNARFTVTGASNVVARNESAFSGGSKKQVTVVSKKDTDKLLSELPKSLEEKIKNELAGKVDQDSSLLPGFTEVTVVSKTFDRQVDAEAKTVTLKGKVTFEALTYKKKDLQELAAAALKREYAENLRISEKGVVTDVQSPEFNEDENAIDATVSIKANLLPTINTDGVKKELVGKSAKDAEAIVKKLPQVTSVKISLSPPLPFIPQFLPRKITNIAVEIKEDE